jgi:hypothetical protein
VLHSTRHTMLTELGIAGADASTIQVIAGHEDIRTSQRYLHPTSENVLMAFERMHVMRRELASRKPVSGTKRACDIPLRDAGAIDRSQKRTAGNL